MTITLIAILTYLINLPFGYWRSKEKRFSLNWFLAIHIPVVITILTRYVIDIDLHWIYIILFILLFAAGQQTGKLIYLKYNKTKPE